MTTLKDQPVPAWAWGPLREVSRSFVLVALGTTALIVLLGWTTGLRELMHISLIAACVFALFPFVVLASLAALLLSVLLVLGLVLASTGADDAPGGIEAHAGDGLLWATRGIAPYYRWLSRHRGSPLLGIPAGLLLGGLLLWAALALFVLPREADTLTRLRKAQVLVEQSYAALGRYPVPGAAGQLAVPAEAEAALEGAWGPARQLLDTWDRPVLYQVKGRWRLQSYRLLSLGSDGVRSADDLCVSGQTRLSALIEAATSLNAAIHALKLEDVSLTERLAGIRAASCGEQD